MDRKGWVPGHLAVGHRVSWDWCQPTVWQGQVPGWLAMGLEGPKTAANQTVGGYIPSVNKVKGELSTSILVAEWVLPASMSPGIVPFTSYLSGRFSKISKLV